jgi:alpha-N-arabinofuranosidase
MRDEFDEENLGMDWVFLGTPYENFYSLSDSKLTMKLLPRSISQEVFKIDIAATEVDKNVPTLGFIGRRQLHANFSMATKMYFLASEENETAGLAIMQACNHQFRLERTMEKGKQILRLIQCTSEINGYPHQPHFQCMTTEEELAKTEVEGEEIILSVSAEGQSYNFYYGSEEENLQLLYENADGRKLNPESVGGMVGTMLCMFASSNEKESKNTAEFEWFDYTETELSLNGKTVLHV